LQTSQGLSVRGRPSMSRNTLQPRFGVTACPASRSGAWPCPAPAANEARAPQLSHRMTIESTVARPMRSRPLILAPAAIRVPPHRRQLSSRGRLRTAPNAFDRRFCISATPCVARGSIGRKPPKGAHSVNVRGRRPTRAPGVQSKGRGPESKPS
jgi:hypothetical protein